MFIQETWICKSVFPDIWKILEVLDFLCGIRGVDYQEPSPTAEGTATPLRAERTSCPQHLRQSEEAQTCPDYDAMSPNCSQIITNDIQYFNRSMENEKWCIFICVNRIIPVPDMSIRLSFRCTAWQFSSVSKHGRGTHTFAACLGSWANVALANNPLKYYRGYWHCMPVESPFAPPMFGVIWFHRTRRMGTCEFMLMYTCQTTLICGSPSPGARWALPVWGPHCITDFAASYRQLYKRKVLGLRIGMKVSYWT